MKNRSVSLFLAAAWAITFIFALFVTFRTINASAAGGLVASYNFNENAGTSFNDLSGNNNSGNLSGGVSFSGSGKTGSALSFNGSDGLASVNDNAQLDLTSGMTLEAWVNPTQLGGWRTIFLKEQTNGLVYALYANNDSNTPSGEVTLTSSGGDSRGSGTLPLNTWTHIAATFDGSTLKFYKNGTLESQKQLSGTIKTSSNPLRIGGNSIWGEYFSGLIDDVRIYNRAISELEINSDMNTPVGNENSSAQPSVSSSPSVIPSVSPSVLPSPSSSPISSADPRAQTGEWSNTMNWPLVAVHASLLPDGKIVMWDGWELTANTRVWNPQSNSFDSKIVDAGLFCSAHSYLPDGRLLVAGGYQENGDGIVDTHIYNFATQTWSKEADMAYKRWYSTTRTLADGRVLSLSGMITGTSWADKPEIFNPQTNSWQTLNINTSSMHDLEYPYVYPKPDGKLYVISPWQGTLHNLDINSLSWGSAGTSPIRYGSLVQYAPGKVLMSGGGSNYNGSSQTKTTVMDLNQANPTWRTVGSMANKRYQHNLVVMPDGKVLVIGGAQTVFLGANDGVLATEVWNPQTESWSPVASMSKTRNYHSVAMLLPDGRVLSAGGGRYGGTTDQFNAQIYSPGYLFKGTRPVISSAPSTASYSSNMVLQSNESASIQKVVMVSLPSVTHSIDMNQNVLELGFTKSGSNLNVSTPTNPNFAPPGYYMVFILDGNGVPSVAKIVRLVSGQSGSPYPSSSPTPTPTPSPSVSISPSPSPSSTINPSPSISPLPSPSSSPVGSLVASYNFEEGSGSAIYDRSGNNHQGSINGTASFSTSGKNGKALSFNGTSNYVSINDSNKLDLTTNMTLEAWVKPSTLTDWRTILVKEAYGAQAYAMYANTNLNKPDGEINTGSAIYEAFGTAKLSTTAWTHMATTYDGSTLRLFINGNQVSQKAVSSTIRVSNGKLFIGGNSMWGEYFKGLIDDIRIYNKALTQGEIQSDMNNPVQ